MDVTILLVGPFASTSVTTEVLLSLDVRGKVESAPDVRPARDAGADFVLTVEGRNRLDLESFQSMWQKKDDAEVVLSSRHVRGGRRASLPIRLAHGFLRKVLRLPFRDVTSGVRLYKTSALRRVVPAGDDPPPLELLVDLHNAGFRIREVGPGGTGSWPSIGNVLRMARKRRSRNAADADDVGFESSLPWRRRRLERRQQTIVSFLEVDVPVLDVGCGSNRLIQALAKGVGIDRDRGKLRFLRGRARATVAGELTRLPFRDGSFPQLVFSDVIRDLAPETEYLPEIRRVLRSRGTLVLATPRGRETEASLRSELERNGFTVDEVRKGRGREIFVRAVRS
jgi:hypothetical protein